MKRNEMYKNEIKKNYSNYLNNSTYKNWSELYKTTIILQDYDSQAEGRGFDTPFPLK